MEVVMENFRGWTLYSHSGRMLIYTQSRRGRYDFGRDLAARSVLSPDQKFELDDRADSY